MKILLLSIMFCGTGILAAFGQEIKEVYPEQASIEHNQSVKNFSKDYVLTLAGFHASPNFQNADEFINIASINVLGSENITILSQQGYDLMGFINVFGNKNHTTLSQKGSDLHSILSIEGNFNEFDLTQQGSGLQNFFQIRGSDTNFDVYQNNFGIEFSQTGIGSIPLSIQQTGRRVPIIIENN